MFPVADINRARRPAILVKYLVAANALVFLYELLLPEQKLKELFYTFGFVPRLFWEDPLGRAYTLFTSMFLHGGIAHILGNMWFLWVFGDNVEDRLGPGRFLAFYLLGGVAAALGQGVLMAGSSAPMIGASGAISAVLGAYYVLFPRAPVLTMVLLFFYPIFFYLPAWFYLGYWALLQFIQALMGVPGIAFWAHLGGFVFGVFSVRWFLPTGPRWIRW